MFAKVMLRASWNQFLGTVGCAYGARLPPLSATAVSQPWMRRRPKGLLTGPNLPSICWPGVFREAVILSKDRWIQECLRWMLLWLSFRVSPAAMRAGQSLNG